MAVSGVEKRCSCFQRNYSTLQPLSITDAKVTTYVSKIWCCDYDQHVTKREVEDLNPTVLSASDVRVQCYALTVPCGKTATS